MTRIAIISIPVADQRRAKQFYTEVLGFAPVRDDPMGPDRRWVQLAPSDGGPTITLVTWFDRMPPGSQQGIVLETSDVRRDHEALRRRGLEISKLQSAPWGEYATFYDPDGNGWVIQQTNAEFVPRPRA